MKKIVVLTMVMLLAGSAWAVIVEDALGAWAFNENTIAEVSGTGAAASLAGGATISGGKVVLRDGQKDGFNFSSVALPFLNQSSFTIYLQDASITRLMAVGMIDYLSWGKTGALCNTTGGRSWIDASNTKLGSWHPVDDSFTEEACVVEIRDSPEPDLRETEIGLLPIIMPLLPSGPLNKSVVLQSRAVKHRLTGPAFRVPLMPVWDLLKIGLERTGPRAYPARALPFGTRSSALPIRQLFWIQLLPQNQRLLCCSVLALSHLSAKDVRRSLEI